MITDDDRPLPFSPMALDVHRATGDVVGRPAELQRSRRSWPRPEAGRLVGLTVEGEPGIGKTRLLVAAARAGDGRRLHRDRRHGRRGAPRPVPGRPLDPRFARGLAVAAGPADRRGARAAASTRCRARTTRASPRSRPTAGCSARSTWAPSPSGPWPPNGRSRSSIDDLQWSDEDSLRLLRYVVRTDGASPIFLMFAIRPEEFAVVTEAVNLVADMDRMGVVRRVKLDRFSQSATREFLAQVLGGPVDASGAAVMHAQAEGVPFIVEEMAFTYRENGMIQEIDGVWTLAGNAERLVPSAVKTLISRRATQAARRDEGAARRRGDPGQTVQPEGPPRDPAPRGRVGARPGGARRDARAGRHGGPADRARGGLGRRLQLPARAGPRVRGRDADARRRAGRSTRRSSRC